MRQSKQSSLLAKSATRMGPLLGAVVLGFLAAACGGDDALDRPGGSIDFEADRPALVQGNPQVEEYAGDDPYVMEAQMRHRTALDLHRNVIIRTCGPTGGVCHNQKEYPDLHTPSNLLAAINAPCNVQPGDWSAVFDGCELPGDRFRIGGETSPVEIGYVDYIPGDPENYERERPNAESAGLHLYLQSPISVGNDRDQTWGEGRFLRNFVGENGQREELTFARFQTQWWLLDGGSHLFGSVQEYQVDRVNELLSVGVQQGDMNRNGVFGARDATPLKMLNAGRPDASYLIGRLRGKIGLAGEEQPIPGTRMPLANDPLTIPDMLALFCFVEGLPEDLNGVYDLESSIDYVNCSYIDDPENLNLLGEGASWRGRVLPLLEANCGGCHGGTEPQGDFNVQDENIYEVLLGASIQQPSMPYITPGDPANSYLWLKLTAAEGITGLPMPIDPLEGIRTLSEGALLDIETWIANGAAEED